jgi:hypothetical protein
MGNSHGQASAVAGVKPARPEAPPARAKAAGAGSLTLNGLIDFFGSLKLTVVCLTLGLILVFIGTLAQVDLGLYKAQNEFFRSFLIYWTPKGSGLKIPVFPGGYLVGGVLLINLVTAHFTRFKWTRKKIGIWMVHVGLILLLVGQLLTDILSRESTMHLRNGESSNYSVTERDAELAVIDVTDAEMAKVVAIPQAQLHRDRTIRHAEMPFGIHVKQFYANSSLENPGSAAGAPPATRGVGSRVAARELPRVTEMERRDVPSAVVEIETAQGPLGSWLVSEFIEEPQTFAYDNRTYQILLRPRRYYEDFSIKLLNFQHDVYSGTDIPKNFSSRVQVERPQTGEKREVLIYMNSPLRYEGQTYYQSGFDPDDGGTILQVVHNPGWLTPYFSCVLVGAGLIVQFLTHLIGFAMKWRTA